MTHRVSIDTLIAQGIGPRDPGVRQILAKCATVPPPTPSASTDTQSILELDCTPLSTPGVVKDPIVAIHVRVQRPDWSVIHIAASGARYERNGQYRVNDASSANNIAWFGTLVGYPHLKMVGRVLLEGDTFYYTEELRDGHKDDAIIMGSRASCARSPATSSTAASEESPPAAPRKSPAEAAEDGLWAEQPTSPPTRQSDIAASATVPDPTPTSTAEGVGDAPYELWTGNSYQTVGHVASAEEICSVFHHPIFGHAVADLNLLVGGIDPNNLAWQWLTNKLGVSELLVKNPELIDNNISACLRRIVAEKPNKYDMVRLILETLPANPSDCLDQKFKTKQNVSDDGVIQDVKEPLARARCVNFDYDRNMLDSSSLATKLAMVTLREAHPPLLAILDQAEARLLPLVKERDEREAKRQAEEQAAKTHPEVITLADLDKIFSDPGFLPEESALAKCILISAIKVGLKWSDHPERIQHELDDACANEAAEVVRLDGEQMATSIALTMGIQGGAVAAGVRQGKVRLLDLQ